MGANVPKCCDIIRESWLVSRLWYRHCRVVISCLCKPNRVPLHMWLDIGPHSTVIIRTNNMCCYCYHHWCLSCFISNIEHLYIQTALLHSFSMWTLRLLYPFEVWKLIFKNWNLKISNLKIWKFDILNNSVNLFGLKAILLKRSFKYQLCTQQQLNTPCKAESPPLKLSFVLTAL